MLAVRVSVCPSVVRTSACPFVRTLFPFDTCNLIIYQRNSFRFCKCICTIFKNVSIGIVNEKISILSDRVMALVNVQIMGFGL